METFVGLEVSLKETSVCVLNQTGTVVFEGKVASEPTAINRLIRKHAADVVGIGLESGPTSVWLTHTLLAEGLPLVCLDARHAQAISLIIRNGAINTPERGAAMSDTTDQVFQDAQVYKVRITRLGNFIQEADGCGCLTGRRRRQDGSWIAKDEAPIQPRKELWDGCDYHCGPRNSPADRS